MDSGGIPACTDKWLEIETRYQYAKQILLSVQQQHCEAAHEYLEARARVQQMLEIIFPEPEQICNAGVLSCCVGD